MVSLPCNLLGFVPEIGVVGLDNSTQGHNQLNILHTYHTISSSIFCGLLVSVSGTLKDIGPHLHSKELGGKAKDYTGQHSSLSTYGCRLMPSGGSLRIVTSDACVGGHLSAVVKL